MGLRAPPSKGARGVDGRSSHIYSGSDTLAGLQPSSVALAAARGPTAPAMPPPPPLTAAAAAAGGEGLASSDRAVGTFLAASSALAIGASFIVKKKGLR